MRSGRSVISFLLSNLAQPAEETIRKVFHSDPDTRLLGRFDDEIELLLAVGEKNADVVVLPMALGKEQGLSSHLLAEYPNLVILGIRYEDSTGLLEQLCPVRRLISDMNPRNLSKELRRAVLSPCS